MPRIATASKSDCSVLKSADSNDKPFYALSRSNCIWLRYCAGD